ncbi:MAG: hypothetical protein ABJH68_13825 [Ilumatobacter sp.]|uniref:hypothetical protein n=1 Tax=Ilumatobacter sp. TaxID=1967498 RepID=UPI00329A1E71
MTLGIRLRRQRSHPEAAPRMPVSGCCLDSLLSPDFCCSARVLAGATASIQGNVMADLPVRSRSPGTNVDISMVRRVETWVRTVWRSAADCAGDASPVELMGKQIAAKGRVQSGNDAEVATTSPNNS